MGHKIKKFETGEMCMNNERKIRFAYLKKRDDQGNFNVNLKMMIVI